MVASSANGSPEAKPELSVIVVSDYNVSGDRVWTELRKTLIALAAQEFAGTAEFLLSEQADVAAQAPEELWRILPSLRIVRSPHTGSYALKNHGVREARADIVAILDADCRPFPDWLSRIAAAFKAYSDAAVISGRTTYEGEGARDRLLALLSRSYFDPGATGATQFISNNNAAWRRSVYLVHPLPTDLGPFAARIQSEGVLRSGGRLFFDPAIQVIHEFEGWPMEADIRRNAGYGTVITRLRDPRMPYAGLVRIGRLSIPLIVAGKTLNSWRDCFRCWRRYNVRWFELPVALVLAPILAVMEVPGMWAAFGDRQISRTAYR